MRAEVLPYLEQESIGFLPFSPLGRGFLLGRFASFDELPENDQRRRQPRFQQEKLLQAAVGSRYRRDPSSEQRQTKEPGATADFQSRP